MKKIFDFTTHESDEHTRSIEKKQYKKEKSDQHTRLQNQNTLIRYNFSDINLKH